MLLLVCLYVFFFVAIGSLWAAVWKRECGDRIIFAPFVVFCGLDLLMVWIAPIYARVTGISEDLYASLVILTSSLAFVLGYVLTHDLIGKRAANSLDFWKRPLVRGSPQAHVFAILACSVLLIRLGWYYYEGAPPILTAITLLLTEGDDDGSVASFASEERFRLTKAHYFGGEYRGQGIVRQVMAVGWPLLASVSWLLFLQRRTLPRLLLSCLLVFACFVYIAGDGTRGPFLWSLVSIVIVLSLVVRIRLRTLLVIGTALLVLFFALSTVKKIAAHARNGTLLTGGVSKLAERIFIGNGLNTVHAIELVRSGQIQMRYGEIHSMDIINALPGTTARDGTPFAYELFTILEPNKRGTTYLSTTYHGKLYGDFGWMGTVVGFFLLGMVLALSSHILFSLRKTVLNTALIGLTCVPLGKSVMTGPIELAPFVATLLPVAAVYATCLSLWTVYRPVTRSVRAAGACRIRASTLQRE